MGKASFAWHNDTNPLVFPVIEGAPSVVIETNFFSGRLSFSTNSMKALKTSSPLVLPCSGISFKSSSLVEKSLKTIRAKTVSWAVSVASQDSSNWSEKYSHVWISSFSWDDTSAARSSTLLDTLLLNSCKSAIAEMILSLFVNSAKRNSAAARNASLMISPSLKGFLDFIRMWLTAKEAAVAALGLLTNIFREDFCWLTLLFSFCSTAFLWVDFKSLKSLSNPGWSVVKCLTMFPFLGIARTVWQIRHILFPSCAHMKYSSSQSGLKT